MKLESITDAVAGLAPTRDAMFVDPRYASSVGDLAGAIVETDRRRWGRPFRLQARRRLAIAIAVAVAVPASTAVAYQWSAHTGWFGSPGMTENDTSEWLRSDAPDFRQVAADLVPDLPLPRGASWTTELDRQVEQGRSAPGLVQVTGVRRTFEAYARCTWIQSWLLAFERDDRQAARLAAGVIAGSSRWPATVATDGGGVVGRIRSLGAAAARGDARPLREELSANCAGFPLAGVR